MSKRWYVSSRLFRFREAGCSARSSSALRVMACRISVRSSSRSKKSSRCATGRRAFPSASSSPGYVLVEMEMNDDTWHLVKSRPEGHRFVGGTANKPTPISEKEVDKIMQQMKDGVDKPRPKVLFEVGEMVRVKEGPFTDFQRFRRGRELRKRVKLRVSVTILVVRRRSNWISVRSRRP